MGAAKSKVAPHHVRERVSAITEAEVQRLTTALAESKTQLQVLSRRYLNNRD
jgi:hypothetical protein